jgi:hypothetical protein
VAAEYFERYPKDRYQTEVESWRNVQSANIEFTMKRLVSRSLRAKPDYETEIPKAREEFKNYRVLLAKKARTTERPQEGKFQWSRDR